MIRSSLVWSPTSRDQVATRPASTSSSARRCQSDWGCCAISCLERFAWARWSPGNVVSAETTVREVQKAADAFGLKIQLLNARNSGEIEAAFAAMSRERAEALFVAPDFFFHGRRVQLAILAARNGIPATYANRDYAEAGGLMSYGTNVTDSFREVGVYVGRILRGEKPADLPVTQPTQFEFVINLQTARALGLDVPSGLLVAADEVIE